MYYWPIPIFGFLDPPPPSTPVPLPLSGYSGYWNNPYTLYTAFNLPLDFASAFDMAGRITATVMAIAGPSIIYYYVAIRIGIMGFIWLAGFVMQKIGKAIPPNSATVVVVREGVAGYAGRRLGLPALPRFRMGAPVLGRRRKGIL